MSEHTKERRVIQCMGSRVKYLTGVDDIQYKAPPQEQLDDLLLAMDNENKRLDKAAKLFREQREALQSANAELVEALGWLARAAGDSNDCQYGTLSASWVREIANKALAKHKGGGK